MPPEDESQYTPHWRSKLNALRLIGRLHDLRAQDPKPVEREEEPTIILPRPIERRKTIRRRRLNPCHTDI